MLRVTIIGVLVAVCAATPVERIVNGTDAAPGEIPYIVSLRGYNSHSCGASILDETHVLTAAHCVYGRDSNPSQFSIQYGVLKISSDSSQSIQATKVVLHPSYISGGGYHNDIAVITLASAIPIEAYGLRATILPKQDDPTPGDQDAVLAGWGYPYSGGGVMQNLQRVDIKVYNDDDCERAHNNMTNRKYHVCAGIPEGGKGQCSGDSGGPLTVDGVQVGVVSWSVKPCTVRGYPGVFAKVSMYVDWIHEQMAL